MNGNNCLGSYRDVYFPLLPFGVWPSLVKSSFQKMLHFFIDVKIKTNHLNICKTWVFQNNPKSWSRINPPVLWMRFLRIKLTYHWACSFALFSNRIHVLLEDHDIWKHANNPCNEDDIFMRKRNMPSWKPHSHEDAHIRGSHNLSESRSCQTTEGLLNTSIWLPNNNFT